MILDRIGLQSLLLPLQIVCLFVKRRKKGTCMIAWRSGSCPVVSHAIVPLSPLPWFFRYHVTFKVEKNITIWWVGSCNVRMLVNLLMAVITDGGSFSALRHLADHSQDESTSRSGSWYLKVGILRLLPANFLTKCLRKEPELLKAVITARSSPNWTIFERVNGS